MRYGSCRVARSRDSTVRYLDVALEDAFAISEDIDL